ncbi:Mut7-C RNAse domain-containing protein [Alkalilimnicola ehrlichii]|uniref:Mut7-C RNAse domain-containing protein n=1 Tax=Alkalilimnicola ehrlichii TaxID=351052 RepID=UPI00384F9D2D
MRNAGSCRFRQVVAEERYLITRDRGFLERRDAERWVVLLETQALDDQARLLRERLGINWLRAPFSRCLVCNCRLHTVLGRQGDLRYCCRCQKLYWEGSHVRRMRCRLKQWQLCPLS